MEALSRPIISHKRGDYPEGTRVIENVEPSLEELFFIEHPQYKKRTPENMTILDAFIAARRADDLWVYFPWRNVAVHTVSEKNYFTLRTSRNRNVITAEHQQRYRDLSIGIAGLSVGSAILQAIVMSGGPQAIKIADFDILEVTNLNRLRADLTDIGEQKSHIAARAIWELDPFADIMLFEKGITDTNLDDFILGDRKLDVFIDEMDSIDLKIKARLKCREQKIPVLMATDNGDGIILDIERFDQEPDRALFHGLIPDVDPTALTNLDFQAWFRLATKIVGPEYLSESMQDSLVGLGKVIPSVPQLGTSASMAGSAVSFALRRIAAQLPLESGRYTLTLEEKLVPDYNTPSEVTRRTEKTQAFIKHLSQPS